MRRAAAFLLAAFLTSALAAPAALRVAAPTPAKGSVRVGTRSLTVTHVRFALGDYEVAVGLAGGQVGGNASLLDIATRSLATCAINGTFLAAYAGQSGEPYGTLAVDGRFLHLGSTGTRLDVLATGDLRFVRDKLRLLGAMDGRWSYPDNWYAYGLNQTPLPGSKNYAYVFTPERGDSLGFRADFAATVVGGRVTRTATRIDAAIPANGFVVAFGGSEATMLARRFTVGRRAEYRVVDAAGAVLDAQPSEDGIAQPRARFSLGAGPRLLTAGRVTVDPTAEGFTQAKILAASGARSAIGLTARKEVLVAVFPSATIREVAEAMRSLGAMEAMNLDGGASSGLVCGGKYLVQPGRSIANAVVVRPRLEYSPA